MAKKQKKNLQKLVQKRQQLQQVSQSVDSTSTVAVSPAGTIALPAPVTLPALPADNHLIKEVSRTLLSFVFIALLLTIAVIIDHKTAFFSNLGDRLFTFLRLKG